MGDLYLVDSTNAFDSLLGSGDKSLPSRGLWSRGGHGWTSTGGETELRVVTASHTGGRTWPGEGRSGVEAEGLGAGPGLQVAERHGDSGGQNA